LIGYTPLPFPVSNYFVPRGPSVGVPVETS
jgi:hypothetical protein